MNSMTRLETFVNLGYKKDPFKGHLIGTGDMVRTLRILTMAVESRAMVSIVGERGCGKTAAIKSALEKQAVKMVFAQREGQEKLTISDVKAAMITGLSEEPVKRGGIVSFSQLRRIVGEAATKQGARPIVVIIEEAQRLHSNTLRSLKTLRELEWAGETELFTIILVAQSDPMNRAGVSEVRLRSDVVRMQGLSANEAAHYVRGTIGKHFDGSAIDALAELPAARNYLELQALCIDLLNIALADGRDQVTVDDVRSISAPAAEPVPKAAPRKIAEPTSSKSALAAVLDRRAGVTELHPEGRATC